MSSRWEPVREPLGVTLRRTVSVALGVGLVLSLVRGRLLMWSLASLIVLWFSLGGHWVEIWFLNWLRPRLPEARAAQVGVRFVVPRRARYSAAGARRSASVTLCPPNASEFVSATSTLRARARFGT